MQVHNVRSAQNRTKRKRVGRGDASRGTYSGKGMKGQKARSGGGVRPGFEGGQNPMIKGLPRLRGFKNPFRTEYQVVNVDRLNALPAEINELSPATLESLRIIRHADKPVKILGFGEISRPISISGVQVSGTARAKIESAGGSVQEG
ncbi:MAG: 50S ribosomal protein L15 [Chloroflexi bacterium]|jgi:large subunit ribosomal protein L15|nr:50S ribosomal protein L15 [Chloroflexota bacterium]MCH2532271.1 50S ribosomal protein L15 [Dehalococcoidia bacterium]HCH36232.1 50S ribosomal protein L15 [Dehalococcoidia bacterium]|tara:strand:- start:2183 stop:2623 length:441 start_codon:yes stop_codon:yes gene_type:complete